jgi:hypothetical protein
MVDPTIQLSAHLTVAAFTKSSTAIRNGIDNSLPDEMLERAKGYAENFYEKIYNLFGEDASIHSGWRCLALNNVLPGSSKTSDHMRANAIDMDYNAKMSLPAAFKKMLQSDLRYKQLMIEGVTVANPKGGWIHGAYDSDKAPEDQEMEIKIVHFVKNPANPDGPLNPQYQPVSFLEALKWCEENV